MANGQIDEDEQRQINKVMSKVESLRAILKPKNQRKKTDSSFLSVSVCCHPVFHLRQSLKNSLAVPALLSTCPHDYLCQPT
jgi:hypothetical protein